MLGCIQPMSSPMMNRMLGLPVPVVAGRRAGFAAAVADRSESAAIAKIAFHQPSVVRMIAASSSMPASVRSTASTATRPRRIRVSVQRQLRLGAAALHRVVITAERGGAVAPRAMRERLLSRAHARRPPVPGGERGILERAREREGHAPRPPFLVEVDGVEVHRRLTRVL